jgi:hypothetical protein
LKHRPFLLSCERILEKSEEEIVGAGETGAVDCRER